MCMNRNYTEEEKKNHDKLASYATRLLMGASVAEIAVSEHISEDEVNKAIIEIGEINPYLKIQIKAMLCGKQIADGATIEEIAEQEKTTVGAVTLWFDEIKHVAPELYAKVMEKIDN